jgi:internalin A
MICKMSDFAPGLIAWLTVRHHDASVGKHWRAGVFLRHPTLKYASEALFELRNDRELLVEVRAPSPDMFFNVLRDSLELLILHRWPGLKYQLFIPCPGTHPNGMPCDSLFPIDGLMRRRETGASGQNCLHCDGEYDVAELLTGFSAPKLKLRRQLEELRSEISAVATDVRHTEELITQGADSMRRVMKAVGVEVTDCPRLITIKFDKRKWRPSSAIERRYVLTLWCEHPGEQHPWPPAIYHINEPAKWLADVAPYLKFLVKALRLAVPIAGAIADVSVPKEQFDVASQEIELMNSLVEALPEAPDSKKWEMDSAGSLTPMEGGALRGIRTLLFRQDPIREFGDLRRVQNASGDFLWICPEHYSKYDPGLPRIPSG